MKKKATKKAKKSAAVQPEKSLVLRTCADDGSSYGSFKWPDTGIVEAPDWKPTKECGNGLHGWLWGSGDWSLKNKAGKIKWLVLEVETKTLIDLGGKVKFPRAVVLKVFHCWNDAMKFIRERLDYKPERTATGDSGHASATGNSGHASATGNYGHASATGNYGHASATGYSGHASATGNSGWAIAGHKGEVKTAKDGAMTCLWHDGKRYRVAVAYAGEDGIEPDTWYRVDAGKWVKA